MGGWEGCVCDVMAPKRLHITNLMSMAKKRFPVTSRHCSSCTLQITQIGMAIAHRCQHGSICFIKVTTRVGRSLLSAPIGVLRRSIFPLLTSVLLRQARKDSMFRFPGAKRHPEMRPWRFGLVIFSSRL